MLHCPFQKFAQWARCCGMQEKLCWHITFIVVQRIVFSCPLLGDWFFLTERQKSVAYFYFFIFNLNWMFSLYLLILQGRLHCIYTVSPSPLVHQYSWSVQTEFHRNWKESRFLTLGFNLWFLLMVEFFWSHQVVNRSAPFTPETFLFTEVKAFTRTKAFLESLQESIRGTATTAGLNHKTADVNTRVFSYALSVNSAWTSESVDVNLKEKGKKCT